MKLSDVRFPRQLEADDAVGAIRRALSTRVRRLWPGGVLEVPVVGATDFLEDALRKARLRNQIRHGLEAISDKLEKEEAGLGNVRDRSNVPQGERVSRLLLFSNDGAERFYRAVETLLQRHSPRLFACLLDVDADALGNMATGRDRAVKAVMVEHKDAVAGILRAIALGQTEARDFLEDDAT